MNILLTCAGRRNYMVQYFRRALGSRGQVFACDSSRSAPALMDADRAFVVPPVNHDDYFDVLADICPRHRVRLLISVYDLEMPGLARQSARFREIGTIPLISSPEVITTCQDKWAVFNFLKASRIPTAATYRSIADLHAALGQRLIRYPLLIKPRWGVSSLGVERIENDRELALAYEWGQVQMNRTVLGKMCQAEPANAFVFQEYLEGTEYGMDVINDLEGRHAATLSRRKLAMRVGNTDRAVSVVDPALERIGQTIGQQLGHVGCLDVDLMATKSGCFVIDLNPRFGGGYPFSHLAGADVPAALIAWANGDEPDPAWLRARPGVVSSKYDAIAVVDPTVASVLGPKELAGCVHMPPAECATNINSPLTEGTSK